MVHLKIFGYKRLNLTESLTWSLCFIVLPFVTFVLWFLCFSFLFLGFALHNIYAFHSRCFFYFIYIYNKKKGRKEKEAHCVLALFSLFLKTRLVNLFSHDMSLVLCLALMSLFIALD